MRDVSGGCGGFMVTSMCEYEATGMCWRIFMLYVSETVWRALEADSLAEAVRVDGLGLDVLR